MSCCDAVYELDPEVGKALLHGQQVDMKKFRPDVSSGRGAAGAITTAEPIRPGKKCGNCGFETEEDLSTVLNAAGDCDGRRCTDGSRREISSPC